MCSNDVLLFLCLLTGCVNANNLSKRQIIFPDGQGQEENQGHGASTLVDLFKADRSSLEVTSKHGAACDDPQGRQGTCQHISDPGCAEFKKALTSGRQFMETVTYIRKFTSHPCGYDGKDITMCCPGDIGGHTPKPPTPSPLTELPKECGVRQVDPAGIFRRSAEAPTITGQIKPPGNRVFIIGGIQSPEGKWPWAVILGQPQGTGGFKVVCGGTLITRQHVLTAAHCFPNNHAADTKITHVRLGEQDVSSVIDGITQVDVELCDIRKHENYAIAKEVKNDITILKLCKPVDFGKYIQPACLPSPGSDPSGTLTVVGWGSEKVGGGAVSALREAEVVRVDLAQCQKHYAAIGGNIDNTHICAGKGSTDTCAGDSGGPMLSTVNSRWTVVGVTSFGVGCANENFPGVYTNVAQFLDWIMGKLT